MEVGIHIAARRSRSARQPARRHRARAAVDRLHARPQDHDAARRRRGDASRWPRARRRRRCRWYVEVSPDGAALRHDDARAAGAGRREPAPRRGRRGLRQRPAVAVRSAVDGRAARAVALAQRLSAARGKSDIQRVDYSFYVDWTAPGSGRRAGRVAIVPRPRGSPLDKLVAELMIFVNSTWGRCSPTRSVAGLYRDAVGGQGQDEHARRRSTRDWASRTTCGRARRCAATATSSTSGSCVAVVDGEKPPYADNDAGLFAALADFEATYAQYAEFQDRMEHYWCLRWLLQEGVTETDASVIRDNLVRFDRLPLVHAPRRPAGAARPTAAVRVGIGRVDLLAATLECRYAGPA